MSSSLPYDDGRGRRRLLCWVGWCDEGDLDRAMVVVARIVGSPYFPFFVYNWEPAISSEPHPPLWRGAVGGPGCVCVQ